MNNIVYLSLGSNLGDRYSNITLAISYISKKKTIKIISESNIYETEPFSMHTGPLDPRIDYTIGRRGIDLNGFGRF